MLLRRTVWDATQSYIERERELMHTIEHKDTLLRRFREELDETHLRLRHLRSQMV